MMMAFLLWGFSTLFHAGDIWKICYLITGVVIDALVILLIYFRDDPAINQKENKQVFIVFLMIVPCLIALLTESLGNTVVFISVVIFLTITLYAIIRLYKHLQYDLGKLFRQVSAKIREEYLLLLLLGCTIVLSYDPNWRQFKWDGAIYYYNSKATDVFSLSSLGVVGHLCQGYVFLNRIADILTFHADCSFYLVNITLLVISVICFNRLLLVIVPERKKYEYLIVTGLYAFSPFALGMVCYYSPDFTFMCLLSPLLYFAYKDQWILHSVTAVFFVFTKEPAIVAYMGICLGILICDVINQKSIRAILMSAKYYLMTSIGILWIALYKMLGAWTVGRTSEDDFGFNSEYVVEKSKTLFVLNFDWILLLLALIGIFYAGRKLRCKLLPIILSLVLFTIFSCYFVTVNHARYTAIVPECLALLAAISVLYICKKRQIICYSIIVAIDLILLISCFTTIDPVSRVSFEEVNIGENIMVTTGMNRSGDSIIYNRQALWLEHLICEGVEYAKENDSVPVFIGDRALYTDDGIVEEYENIDSYRLLSEYWDTKRAFRSLTKGLDKEELKILVSDDIESLPSGRFCYIRIPDPADEQDYVHHGQCRIVENREMFYRGWKVIAYIIEKD